MNYLSSWTFEEDDEVEKIIESMNRFFTRNPSAKGRKVCYNEEEKKDNI